MKKAFLLVLSVLVVFAFASCSGDNPAPNGEAGSGVIVEGVTIELPDYGVPEVNSDWTGLDGIREAVNTIYDEFFGLSNNHPLERYNVQYSINSASEVIEKYDSTTDKGLIGISSTTNDFKILKPGSTYVISGDSMVVNGVTYSNGHPDFMTLVNEFGIIQNSDVGQYNENYTKYEFEDQDIAGESGYKLIKTESYVSFNSTTQQPFAYQCYSFELDRPYHDITSIKVYDVLSSGEKLVEVLDEEYAGVYSLN